MSPLLLNTTAVCTFKKVTGVPLVVAFVVVVVVVAVVVALLASD